MNRLLLPLILLVVLLTACGSERDDCDRVAETVPAAGAPVVVLVVDPTASHAGRGLAPAVRTALIEAQASGASLDIVAVDGTGVPPRTVRRGVALDPSPDVQSDAADAARALVPGCVERWAAQARPSAPGSDVLAALNEATRGRPERLIVASDGYATAGALDLTVTGFDAEPAGVARDVRDELTDGIVGLPVLWVGLGDGKGDGGAEPREPIRRAVTALWAEVLADAELTIDPGTGPDLTPADDLPADPLAFPEVHTEGETVVLPDALLFTPGSALLGTDADAVLAPVAADLTAGASAVVIGHCADYGDAGYQQRISEQRATAVAERLVLLGADAAALRVVGAGNTDPARPEWIDGVHDLAAAAANRRVEITLTR